MTKYGVLEKRGRKSRGKDGGKIRKKPGDPSCSILKIKSGDREECVARRKKTRKRGRVDLWKGKMFGKEGNRDSSSN